MAFAICPPWGAGHSPSLGCVLGFIQCCLMLLLSWTLDLSLAAGTTSSRTVGGHVLLNNPDHSTSHSSSSLHHHHDRGHHHTGHMDHSDDEGYWREIKAIIGGVLGFWGGVGSMGTLFLVVVLSQRYCCKKDDDKDDADG